ncbi:MAG: threonine-phosphate decarboxylase CobD [Gammaproteobacteria bacterium]|nr:threonine-phosphate decarboxylase CobD [Gammaproteobacteria bacterium]
MLEHGGRLNDAARQYAIPQQRWLDLSTGINSDGWPVPKVPAECWNRLPEDDDGLLPAACSYYGINQLLPVAGSQAAIQCLPRLREPCKVGVFAPAYAEHAHAWSQSGHTVIILHDTQPDIAACDVVVVINPNNPTARLWPVAVLQQWQMELSARGGWLVVDEAFLDAEGDARSSMLAHSGEHGLIVLRSLGKFFGLAGLRVGFVAAWPFLLERLQNLLGPWGISHPARWVATEALQDRQWQQQARKLLLQRSERLVQLLSEYGLTPQAGTKLFQWVVDERAELWQQALAKEAIWVRRFSQPASLRFGLPINERQWQQLALALGKIEEERVIHVA